MTASLSRSYSSTFTEARVREVMKPVFDDIIVIANRGFIDSEQARKWYDDLSYMLLSEAISSFEFQFKQPGGRKGAVRYEVSDDGSLLESSRSGGLQLYWLPDDTAADLVVSFRKMEQDVKAELNRRGWTRDASFVPGAAVRERAYSSEGYGLIRNRIGDWE